ncbi:MAG: hypothetical protein AAFU41_04095 [Pseudomonadota bacterium]
MSIRKRILRVLGLGGPSASQSSSALHPIEELKRKHPEKVEDWFAEPDVVPVWGGNPERFVQNLDSDTLHEIGCKLRWDDTVPWFLAIAGHPLCDHATLWNMYHLAAPDFYESKMRESGSSRDVFEGMDAQVVELLDLIVARFQQDDVASKTFRRDEEFPAIMVKAQQQAARDQGSPLIWELPDAAFAETVGEHHAPQYEVSMGDRILPAFDKWLAVRA